MTFFDIIAILLTLSATFSYINYRYVRLPTTIGLMLIALLMSIGLIILGKLGLGIQQDAQRLLRQIDFESLLLHGMLSFLLFAGALHVGLDDLSRQKWVILLLATVGVVGSTFLVGALSWFAFEWAGLKIPFIFCLLFGALISPTDPIAVIGILRSAGTPKSLEVKIAGESLFNDGIAVVIFLALLEIAAGRHVPTPGEILILFTQEAVGGVLFGLAAGAGGYWMLKRVDNYEVEILITLALAAGGYALAEALHLSAPIAVVVAGLLIGNHGRLFAMSEKTREHLDLFWELIDAILNAVLFVLIGLEVLTLTFPRSVLLAGVVAIPIVLLARWISVGLPILAMTPFHPFAPGAVWIMTWAGLRGGISVAMALALPAGPHRGSLLAVTYSVVVFSIFFQGLTVGRLIRWIASRGAAASERDSAENRDHA